MNQTEAITVRVDPVVRRKLEFYADAWGVTIGVAAKRLILACMKGAIASEVSTIAEIAEDKYRDHPKPLRFQLAVEGLNI